MALSWQLTSTSSALLTSPSFSVNMHCSFTKLDAYLKAMHDEATLAVVSANTSKAKKVKNEEKADDKKRKATANVSQGVDKLKKANINGMAKMSSFFKKAA